jgi:hypothetical protein
MTGTGPDGVTSQVMVVKSIRELRNRSSEVPGPWQALSRSKCVCMYACVSEMCVCV